MVAALSNMGRPFAGLVAGASRGTWVPPGEIRNPVVEGVAQVPVPAAGPRLRARRR